VTVASNSWPALVDNCSTAPGCGIDGTANRFVNRTVPLSIG
jgi:hypothetical protein